jgi:uncharacterized protein YfaP (DUF2135 family)/uncharacterized protein YoxC
MFPEDFDDDAFDFEPIADAKKPDPAAAGKPADAAPDAPGEAVGAAELHRYEDLLTRLPEVATPLMHLIDGFEELTNDTIARAIREFAGNARDALDAWKVDAGSAEMQRFDRLAEVAADATALRDGLLDLSVSLKYLRRVRPEGFQDMGTWRLAQRVRACLTTDDLHELAEVIKLLDELLADTPEHYLAPYMPRLKRRYDALVPPAVDARRAAMSPDVDAGDHGAVAAALGPLESAADFLKVAHDFWAHPQLAEALAAAEDRRRELVAGLAAMLESARDSKQLEPITEALAAVEPIAPTSQSGRDLAELIAALRDLAEMLRHGAADAARKALESDDPGVVWTALELLRGQPEAELAPGTELGGLLGKVEAHHDALLAKLVADIDAAIAGTSIEAIDDCVARIDSYVANRPGHDVEQRKPELAARRQELLDQAARDEELRAAYAKLKAKVESTLDEPDLDLDLLAALLAEIDEHPVVPHEMSADLRARVLARMERLRRFEKVFAADVSTDAQARLDEATDGIGAEETPVYERAIEKSTRHIDALKGLETARQRVKDLLAALPGATDLGATASEATEARATAAAALDAPDDGCPGRESPQREVLALHDRSELIASDFAALATMFPNARRKLADPSGKSAPGLHKPASSVASDLRKRQRTLDLATALQGSLSQGSQAMSHAAKIEEAVTGRRPPLEKGLKEFGDGGPQPADIGAAPADDAPPEDWQAYYDRIEPLLTESTSRLAKVRGLRDDAEALLNELTSDATRADVRRTDDVLEAEQKIVAWFEAEAAAVQALFEALNGVALSVEGDNQAIHAAAERAKAKIAEAEAARQAALAAARAAKRRRMMITAAVVLLLIAAGVIAVFVVLDQQEQARRQLAQDLLQQGRDAAGAVIAEPIRTADGAIDDFLSNAANRADFGGEFAPVLAALDSRLRDVTAFVNRLDALHTRADNALATGTDVAGTVAAIDDFTADPAIAELRSVDPHRASVAELVDKREQLAELGARLRLAGLGDRVDEYADSVDVDSLQAILDALERQLAATDDPYERKLLEEWRNAIRDRLATARDLATALEALLERGRAAREAERLDPIVGFLAEARAFLAGEGKAHAGVVDPLVAEVERRRGYVAERIERFDANRDAAESALDAGDAARMSAARAEAVDFRETGRPLSWMGEELDRLIAELGGGALDALAGRGLRSEDPEVIREVRAQVEAATAQPGIDAAEAGRVVTALSRRESYFSRRDQAVSALQSALNTPNATIAQLTRAADRGDATRREINAGERSYETFGVEPQDDPISPLVRQARERAGLQAAAGDLLDLTPFRPLNPEKKEVLSVADPRLREIRALKPRLDAALADAEPGVLGELAADLAGFQAMLDALITAWDDPEAEKQSRAGRTAIDTLGRRHANLDEHAAILRNLLPGTPRYDITLTGPERTDARVATIEGTIRPRGANPRLDVVRIYVNGTFSQTAEVTAGSFATVVVLNSGDNTVTAAPGEDPLAPGAATIAIFSTVARSKLNVKLTWDKGNRTDVDLHVLRISPDGSERRFWWSDKGDPRKPWTGSLDVDNTVGHGPENFSTAVKPGEKMPPGTYRVYVVYYQGPAPTTWTIEVKWDEGTPQERLLIFAGRAERASKRKEDRNNTLVYTFQIGEDGEVVEGTEQRNPDYFRPDASAAGTGE